MEHDECGAGGSALLSRFGVGGRGQDPVAVIVGSDHWADGEAAGVWERRTDAAEWCRINGTSRRTATAARID